MSLAFQSLQNRHTRKVLTGGNWVAQLVEHVTPDLGIVSLSPTLGAEITQK